MGRYPVLLGGVLAGAVWMACVGEDPVTGGGPAVGDRLGACFPDGKCKEGLECRLPERICLTPGEPLPDAGGADGGDDGPVSTDAGSDTTIDAAVCARTPQATGPGPNCAGSQCAKGEACCSAGGTVSCADKSVCETNLQPKVFACDGPGACGGTLRCCVGARPASPAVKGVCGERFIGDGSYCSDVACAAGESTACTRNEDCAGGTCAPLEIELAPNQIVVWGACTK
jgi:hypothetical protein